MNSWKANRFRVLVLATGVGLVSGAALSVMMGAAGNALRTIKTQKLEIVNSRGVVVVRIGPDRQGNGQIELFDRNGRLVATSGGGNHADVGVPQPQQRVGGRVYAGIGGGHWVGEKIDSGKMIKLEDGSLWEISAMSRIDTMLWLPTESITVTEGDTPGYPYMLVNTDSGESAAAKLLDQ